MGKPKTRSKATKPRIPPEHLEAWLAAKPDTVSREKALSSRLISDLILAAGARGYGLGVYEPLVDRDGFDLIVDDADRMAPVQIKSRIKSGATTWGIKKDLLLPTLEMDPEALGFNGWHGGIGRGGGVILQDIHKIDNDRARIEFTYKYTDIYVLLALEQQFFPGTAKEQRLKKKAATLVLSNLRQGSGKQKIPLPLNTFVSAAGTPQLLALMGMHSTSQKTAWRHNIVQYIDLGPATPQNEHFRGLNQAAQALQKKGIEQYIRDQLLDLVTV